MRFVIYGFGASYYSSWPRTHESGSSGVLHRNSKNSKTILFIFDANNRLIKFLVVLTALLLLFSSKLLHFENVVRSKFSKLTLLSLFT